MGNRRVRPLDGLRGLAALIVVAYHLRIGVVNRGGWISVELFFVLSGFLITTGLLRHHDQSGNVGARRFLRARADRLLPALLLVLAVSAPIALWLSPARERTDLPITLFSSATFTSNYVEALDIGHFGIWNHIWSLGVEVQFYVLWLVALGGALLVLGRRRILGFVVAVAVLAQLWRMGLWAVGAPQTWLYHASDARAGSLLLGALIAVLVADRPHWFADRRAARAAGLVSLVALLIACRVMTDSATNLAFGLLIVGGCAAVVVGTAATSTGGVVHRALSWRPLVVIGELSFGLYLWHKVVIKLVDQQIAAGRVTLSRPEAVILEVAVFSVLTYVTWRIERAYAAARRAPTPRPTPVTVSD